MFKKYLFLAVVRFDLKHLEPRNGGVWPIPGEIALRQEKCPSPVPDAVERVCSQRALKSPRLHRVTIRPQQYKQRHVYIKETPTKRLRWRDQLKRCVLQGEGLIGQRSRFRSVLGLRYKLNGSWCVSRTANVWLVAPVSQVELTKPVELTYACPAPMCLQTYLSFGNDRVVQVVVDWHFPSSKC